MRPSKLDQQMLQTIQHSEEVAQSRFIRDCLWSVFGTNLLTSELGAIDTSSVHNQQLIDALAKNLPDNNDTSWPRTNPATIRRLGHQFEACWHAMLDQCGLTYLANIPIRNHGKQTLGELDLIIANPNNPLKWWHIEFAVKFYLGYQFDNGSNLWIGPNQRDHFVDKLKHMKHQQLPLVKRIEATHALHNCDPTITQDSIEISLPIMRGCLFYPANPDIGGHPELPIGVNPNSWRGLWVRFKDAPHYLPDGYWTILPKYRWLSPAFVNDTVDLTAMLQYLESYFAHLNAPLCLVNLQQVDECLWHEHQRWFVVPDNWTDTLQPHDDN